jgi:CRP-like cAMP-binding protein
LHGPGDQIATVYFPITALIGLSKETSEGLAMDTAIIGSEAMVGLRGLIGPSVHRVTVSSTGSAYKMPITSLRHFFYTDGAISQMCWQAADRISQMTVAESACSRFHSIDQRIAKWLLTRLERTGLQLIEATHQFIGDSLGVRRESVTTALKKLSCISTHRGAINVLNQAKLEKVSCECYAIEREMRTKQLQLPR